MSRPSQTVRLPWVTLLLAAAIFLCYAAGSTQAFGWLSDLLAEDFAQIQRGRVWQFATFWLIHLDLQHLLWDAAYLLIVGSWVELAFGHWRVILVFLGGTIAGGIFTFAFDSRFGGIAGSSDGSHGLAAYLCCKMLFNDRTSKTLWAIATAWWLYIIFLTMWALLFGKMGWPLGRFANGGFDHLGGILVGTIAAMIEARKIFAAKVSNGAPDE